MNRLLSEMGCIPITTSVIESLYSELKSTNKKVAWLEKQGYIIRLKRGLYVVSPKYSGKMLSTELIANHLYAPSYISMSTALRYYGLIPEAVYVNQSMTIKHSRHFQTPIGNYDYKYISCWVEKFAKRRLCLFDCFARKSIVRFDCQFIKGLFTLHERCRELSGA